MNRERFHVRSVYSRRPLQSALFLAFLTCLTAFGDRALLAQPIPLVTFGAGDVPPEVLIGEDFTFKVRFKNAGNPGDFGFGPFIDLVLDAGGANMKKPVHTPACHCDGITFLQASMINVNGGAVALNAFPVSAPCNPTPITVPLQHPFLVPSQVQQVMAPAGAQLVTLELPFGNFDGTQPEIVVEVKVHLSNLADAGVHLAIFARGGFRYGLEALDDPGPNLAPPLFDCPILSDMPAFTPPCANAIPLPSPQWQAQAQTTPTVMTISKKYSGPENEAVTGPNFTGYYPLGYVIAVDIADGQTISNLVIQDFLPPNLQFAGNLQVTLLNNAATPVASCGSSPTDVVISTPSTAGGTISVTVCNPITGLPPGLPATPHEVLISFNFFIPEFDNAGNPVLSQTCASAVSVNNIEADGDWTPIDVPCDSPIHVVSDVTPADHTLMDKCLAIQKAVAPLNPIPGNTLFYTLTFQLSDFKTAGHLKIQDILSDGQTLDPLSLTLSVTDQCGTTSTAITPFPQAALTNFPLTCVPGAPPPRTEVDIDVSMAMMLLATPAGPFRHQHGILTGGHAFPPALPLLTVPATGTITFTAKVDDAYQCPVASKHDQFVDKDDPLSNTVTLNAEIFTNQGDCSTTLPSATGVFAKDGSRTDIAILADSLEKTVYQVLGAPGHQTSCGPTPPNPACSPKPEVFPGDIVTFRLKKTIFSGDAENLTIKDWLPLPTFLAAGGGFNYSQCGVPPVGSSCFGPANTLLPPIVQPGVPNYLADGLTNSLTFDYGTFNDPANQQQTIDLLFTRVVTIDPFADGLYLANEARECEDNSFGDNFCQTAIAQVHAREPALKITKGVVAVESTNTNAVFSPPPPPVHFSNPGAACPPARFTGTIDSAYLASTPAPIDSNISNVDANDCVTFAVVVENTGGSAAYDVQLRDLFPVGPTGALDCFGPVFTSFCVTDGTGTPLPFNLSVGSNTNEAIFLSNPLPGLNSSSLPGSNIALITFDACVLGNIQPHCCDNLARVENYSSTSGGANFVGTGFGGPNQDIAQVCVLPRATKSIKTTSEAHTPGTPPGPALSPEQLAIGEIIRYRLEVLVPETTAVNNTYVLKDLLPPGLQFLDDHTAKLAFVSALPSMSSSDPAIGTSPFQAGNQVTLSGITPVVPLPPSAIPTTTFVCGTQPSFNLSNITNSHNDPDQEFIVLEFNARVCNVVGNQNPPPTFLPNQFAVFLNGSQATTSNAVNAVVVEPHLAMTKTVSPNPVLQGGTVTYTVAITNNGTATAFDILFTDTLPAGLTPVQASLTLPLGWFGSISGQSINVNCSSLACNGMHVGGPFFITYQAVATATCPTTLTNQATITWTSLPGPTGTTPNATGSTAGVSGAPDGERNGSDGPTGLLNDYATAASAPLTVNCPCAVDVHDGPISCDSNGTITYTFTIMSAAAIPQITFDPPQNQGVTMTFNPAMIVPLPANTPITVTATITGAVPGTSICFTVVLQGPSVILRCDRCITIPQCCVQPPAGMIAWYPLDEGLGAPSVADVAVNGHNGTPQPGLVGLGGPNSGAPNIPPAVVSGAFYFPDGSKYVQVPDSPPLSLDIGSGDFSIDAWVLVNGGPAAIVDKFDAAAHTGYKLYLDAPFTASGTTLYFSYGDGSANLTVPSLMPIPFHQWHHVAVTVARSAAIPFLQVLFYVDGAPQGGQSVIVPVGSIANTLDLFIGGFHPPTAGATEIGIDELEIFGRKLEAQEIKDIFNAGPAGKCLAGHRIGVVPTLAPRPPVRHIPFH